MIRLHPIFLISLVVISACTMRDPALLPSEAMVLFSTEGKVLGKGVISDSRNILTATHVAEVCIVEKCKVKTYYGVRDIGDFNIYSYGEKSSLVSNNSNKSSHPPPSVDIGDAIYVLVSSGAEMIRKDGIITALDSSYIGYDRSLYPRIYSGAIEIDIIFEGGESGTPIWTLSGELVGVVSAVDRERGRSYIVR